MRSRQMYYSILKYRKQSEIVGRKLLRDMAWGCPAATKHPHTTQVNDRSCLTRIHPIIRKAYFQYAEVILRYHLITKFIIYENQLSQVNNRRKEYV